MSRLSPHSERIKQYYILLLPSSNPLLYVNLVLGVWVGIEARKQSPSYIATRDRINASTGVAFSKGLSGNNHVNEPVPLWRTHSCVQRRHSCRRTGRSSQNVEKNLDTPRHECVLHMKWHGDFLTGPNHSHYAIC